MSARIARPAESAVAIARRTVAAIWAHPENRGRRLWALSKFVAWQVWERTVRRPWTVGLVEGIRLRCYPHSPTTSAVIYYRLADHQEMHFVLDYLRPDDLFVDVGANAGVYSLLACSLPGVSVVALEPSTAAFERALENIRLNSLEDRVALMKMAAGKSEGLYQLTVGLDAMNSLVHEAHEGPTEPVPVTTLDALAHCVAGAAIIKIDVEGWETDVLEGATHLLTAYRPALIVEVNDREGIGEVCRRLNYECVRYRPGRRELVPAALPDAPGANAILVPNLQEAVERIRRDRTCQTSKPDP